MPYCSDKLLFLLLLLLFVINLPGRDPICPLNVVGTDYCKMPWLLKNTKFFSSVLHLSLTIYIGILMMSSMLSENVNQG